MRTVRVTVTWEDELETVPEVGDLLTLRIEGVDRTFGVESVEPYQRAYQTPEFGTAIVLTGGKASEPEDGGESPEDEGS